MAERKDLAKCPCGNTWFEQFRVSQFSTNHLTAPGQFVAPVTQDYVVLRCVKCMELFQPNMTVLTGTLLKDYDNFKDEIDKPKPEAPTSEPTD